MRPNPITLFVPRLVVLLIIFCSNAGAQSPDFQSLVHVFPQFVHGSVSENRSYSSSLQISATDFSFPTRCRFGLWSMLPTTLIDARGVAETNVVFNFVLAPNGWQILQSRGIRNLQAGSAILECDRPVTAHLVYTLNNDGAISSEATVSAAPAGRVVQILTDQRRNSRLGLAIMNPFSTVAWYRISVVDINGQLVSATVLQLPPAQPFSGFLDEFVAIPRDYRGPIVIETINGTDVYAAALRFNRESFTAIPAMVRIR
jgi:hypothetical protein